MTERKVQKTAKKGTTPTKAVKAAVKAVNAKRATKPKPQNPKIPTLKEQLSNWKEQYAVLSEDYHDMIHDLSYKDMELSNCKSKVSKIEEEIERLKCTPWYTKLLNFFKGD